MIERGSGRTSGLTDWRLMDALSMWACLQDQDTTGHWKQVAGWRKVCDLALAHLSRLQEYRRGLAEAWPPESNAAARAYIGELDQLIEKVQHTHDAAAANYDALAAATRALSSTRADLKPIYEEYAVKLQQKRAYEAVVADPKAAAGSRLPEQPPVTDADLEQLNVQARSLMTGLSGELQQAQVMLQKPPAMRPPVHSGDPDVYGGSSATAPVIPPIVPVPVATFASAGSVSRSATTAPPVPTPAAQGTGSVLGGAVIGLAQAPVNPIVHGPNPTVPPTPPPGMGLTPTLPGVSGSPILRGTPSKLGKQPGPVGRLVGDGLNRSPHPAPPRPMPPGGLIGGTPGMGLGQPREATPRRVNPISGLIGGGGAGTAPTGGAGSRPSARRASQFNGMHGVPPIGGAPGSSITSGASSPSPGAHRQEHSDSESRCWNPEEPWEIDEGVNPVMRPPEADGPIDPGPAIGFDR
ncbi:hypothetical protein DLE60_04270 [Micromonospora globispora]|uniref:PPE family domain-containing protein n=1 Tax=Micromonospora globispora TaxID=1450148 RepID=A0A317JW41_9ACTN|nr:hypothetical protein [Micromonospora globispora]PWU44905.1 hypothetical protein DLJ46_23505 [Micromonospora globispora]PWU61701.1 hypothetical protein DLE60_04270 [Micromonospora globispora]RQW87093.1 hypothetical protein DKL51_26470 [Micromonospora globispora]